MKNELLRRLSILEGTKTPQISARTLRGGMQERLHRQEIVRFRKDIESSKSKIKKRLASIAEKEKNDMIQSELGTMSFGVQSVEPLDAFHEPTMRRVRSKRGFF